MPTTDPYRGAGFPLPAEGIYDAFPLPARHQPHPIREDIIPILCLLPACAAVGAFTGYVFLVFSGALP